MEFFLAPVKTKKGLKTRKNEFLREQRWDSRFSYGKPPEYKVAEDRHLHLFLITSSQKRLIVPRLYSIDSKTLKTPTVTKQKALEELEFKYEQLLNILDIDPYFFLVFKKTIEILPNKAKIYQLLGEIRSTSKGNSKLQCAIFRVKEREDCLLSIKSRLNSTQFSFEELQNFFVKNLQNLREISIIAFKSIEEWKEHLYQINQMNEIVFVKNGENYLIKMMTDLYFLAKSPLIEFFEFSSKNDPFLKHPSQLNTKLGLKKMVIPVSSALALQIRHCEGKLIEETLFVSSQRPVKAQIFVSPLAKFLEIKGNVLKKLKFYENKADAVFGSAVDAYKSSFFYRFPMFFWVSSEGLAILAVSKQATVGNTLSILHLSTGIDEFLVVLTGLLGFICNNYCCSEIRYEITPKLSTEGKYEADILIKSALKAVGFRWKQTISRENTLPLQIFYMKVPQNPKGCKSIFEDTIKLQYIYLDIANKSFPNYSYLGALALKCEDFEEISELLPKVPHNYLPSHFRTDISDSIEKISKSTSKLSVSFNTFHISIYKKSRYLYIYDTDITVLVSNKTICYVIPTEDENITAVFVLAESSEKVVENLNQILKKAEKKSKITEICVPGFALKTKNTSENLEISLSTGSGALGLHYASACETIIDQGFIFGIIDLPVDELLEVPYFAVYVNATSFEKALH